MRKRGLSDNDRQLLKETLKTIPTAIRGTSVNSSLVEDERQYGQIAESGGTVMNAVMPAR
jgi:hypothetical protein